MFTLRPYQEEARSAIESEWAKGVKRTLLVLCTGLGKTVVFSKVIEDCVRNGERVLVMAHRGELLDQAADKLEKATGLKCAVEKAEQTCLGTWNRVVVGSVQSLQRDKRLERFDPGYFNTIVVDEAHHVLANGYQKVMEHFSNAKVLGVTATAERSDMQNLGSFFESLAYEYSLPRAIREGYLCKIMAQTVPLKIDLNNVGIQNGDYAAGETAEALDPYLEQIASEMETYCKDRKTVVFLPLIKTSQKFCEILNRHGFKAAEVNGNSADRAEILEDFENGEYNVLCNAMLLTEGWDCPSVDCVIVLRPTKVRALYVQMVGRGTRLSPGKKDLLVLDFLWMSERHELCRPADIICKDKDVARKMTERLSEDAGMAIDIEEAEEQASKDVVAERESKLAEQLKEMRTRKRKLVDPLQYAMSIQAEDLSDYQPTFGWEMAPPSQKQIDALQKLGIFPDQIENAGMAAKLLNHLHARIEAKLSTPKQIRLLENKGFQHVGSWPFQDASKMISRMSYNNWHVPAGINPATYVPESLRGDEYE